MERRTRALERAHGEVADHRTKLLAQIVERDLHIAKIRVEEWQANEERVLRAALHKADKEASILKAARATEYARLQSLSAVMADEERLEIEAHAKLSLDRERQQNKRKLIIARDSIHATMTKA